MGEKKSPVTVRVLCIAAMLMALEIVLARFCSINTPYIRIGFSFIPMALCGMLLGPVWGGVCYGAADILGAALFSTGVFPGIVLARILSGVIFGLFLHREKLRFFPHILGAALCEQIFCSLGLTTLALALSAGTSYWAMLLTRLPQAAVMIVILLAVLPALTQLRRALDRANLLPRMKEKEC